ncbi:MAG: DNA-processing protein DprA [Clostridiales bacterium]|nr:DNA-processing protein DprA [Clostridiales bacterium]
MSELKYWLWLSQALGAGARVDEIVAAYPDPGILYSETRTGRAASGVFTKAQLDRLEKCPLTNAENSINLCKRNNWGILTPMSADYPESLRTLPDMPLALFFDGDAGFINKTVCIGVVGTRNPTPEGVELTRSISFDIASAGITVVSGGAIGIDCASHEGALSAGGKTVCVMGCGLGTRYLVQNEHLRSLISKNGVLLTEYPPFAPAGRTTFPLRNRIISGLSEGLLVVEAGEKSGSLITARYALQQGRDVFAVPGSVLSDAYVGTNRLIKDGARVVTGAGDIIFSLKLRFPDLIGEIPREGAKPVPASENPVFAVTAQKEENKVKTEKAAKKREAPLSLGEKEKKVYSFIDCEPVYFDDLCALTGFNAGDVSFAVTVLEIEGLIECSGGRAYKAKA